MTRERASFGVLLLLAAIGGALLLVVAVMWWQDAHDQAAYWRAGERLLEGRPVYDLRDTPVTPYAYWNPPPLAQVLAPLTSVVPERAFVIAWAALQLACLLYIAEGDVLVALAMIAFIPVAVELGAGNLHIVIAALVVLGLRRSPAWFVVATALKVGPIVGAVYLAAAGRRRDALLVLGLGAAVLGISVALSPALWREFVETVVPRADGASGLVGIPYVARLVVAVVLARFAGRLGGRPGELVFAVALVVANPTLWLNALSLLIVGVPALRAIVRESFRAHDLASASPRPSAAGRVEERTAPV